MIVFHDFVVDFARPNKSNTLIISEGDKNSRGIHFVLLANKQPMDMIDVSVATVKGVKADGSVIFGDATIIKDDKGNNLNELEYVLPGNLSDLANKVTMTVSLMSNTGAVLNSFEYYVEVRNALYSEDDYISEEDLMGFKDILNRAMAALEKMEVMTESDALPNPYPLNITLEDEEYHYNGADQIDMEIKNLTYIGDDYEADAEDIDQTAAGIAVDAADKAKTSSEVAEVCKDAAEYAMNHAKTYCDNAEGYAETCRNDVGMVSAYTTQVRAIAEELNSKWANMLADIADLKAKLADIENQTTPQEIDGYFTEVFGDN